MDVGNKLHDNSIIENVDEWIESIPMEINTDAEQKTFDRTRKSLIKTLKRTIPAGNTEESKDETIKHIKQLPLAPDLRNDREFIKDKADELVDNLTLFNHSKDRRYGMSFTGLNEFLDGWLEKVHIDDDTKTPEEIKQMKQAIKQELLNKIGEMNVDPEIFNDDKLYEEILRDVLGNLFDNIDVLDINFQDLKEDLIAKVLEAQRRAQDEITGQAYKKNLRDTMSRTLPDPQNLSAEERALLEVMKNQLADKFINLHYSGDDEDLKRNLKKKIAGEIKNFCDDILQRHPGQPLNSEQLNRDLYNALKNISKPPYESMRNEVDQIRIREEIQEWLRELPLQPQKPKELLARNKMAYVLSKKLFEIETEFDEPQNEEFMWTEIKRFLKKQPLKPGEEQNINKYVQKLIDKLKATEDTRKKINETPLTVTDDRIRTNIGVPGGPQSGVSDSPNSGVPGVPHSGVPGPYNGAPGGPQRDVAGPYGGVPGSYSSVPGPYSGGPGGPQSGVPGHYSGVPGPYSGVPGGPQNGVSDNLNSGVPGPYIGVPGPYSGVPGRPQSGVSDNFNNGVPGPYSGVPGGPQSGVPGPYGGVPGGPQSGVPGNYNGVPGGPQSGVPGPYSGVPGGPQSGVPGPYGGVPGSYSGIPGGPQSGISDSPNSGVPGVPYSGIPGGPQSSVPGHYSGVLGGPQSGISDNPNSGVPGPYSGVPGPYSGVPGGPQSSVPGPYSGVPGASQSGVPGHYSGVPGGPQSGVPGPYSGVQGGPQSGVPGHYSGVPGGPQSGVSDSPNSGVPGVLHSGVPGPYSGVPGPYSGVPGGPQSGVPGPFGRVPGSYSGVPGGPQSAVPGHYSCVPGGLQSGSPGPYSGVPGGPQSGVPGPYSGVPGGPQSGVPGPYRDVPGGPQSGVPGPYSGVPPSMNDQVCPHYKPPCARRESSPCRRKSVSSSCNAPELAPCGRKTPCYIPPSERKSPSPFERKSSERKPWVVPTASSTFPPCSLSPDDMAHLERIRERACLSPKCTSALIQGKRNTAVGAKPIDAGSQTELRPPQSPVSPMNINSSEPYPGMPSNQDRRTSLPSNPIATEIESQEIQPHIVIKEYYWDSPDGTNVENPQSQPTDPQQQRTETQRPAQQLPCDNSFPCPGAPPPRSGYSPQRSCQMPQDRSSCGFLPSSRSQFEPSCSPLSQPFSPPQQSTPMNASASCRVNKRDGLQDQAACTTSCRGYRRERVIELGSLDDLREPRPKKRPDRSDRGCDQFDWNSKFPDEDTFWETPIRRVLLDEGIDEPLLMERERKEERVRCKCKEKLFPKSRSRTYQPMYHTYNEEGGLQRCSRCCGIHCPYPSYLYFR